MSERVPDDRRPTGVVVAIAVLLAAPVVALMWVGSYARAEPRLLGFPFFYWYQFAWVFLTAVCTASAYHLLMRVRGERPADYTDIEGDVR
jgi:membrane protein implicated in regulation of membrane protease activity